MNCTRLIWSKWRIYPILQNRNCTLYKIVGAARNWINSVPQIEATTFAFSSMTTSAPPTNDRETNTCTIRHQATQFRVLHLLDRWGLNVSILQAWVSNFLGWIFHESFIPNCFFFRGEMAVSQSRKVFLLLQFHENFKQQKLMNIFNIIIFLWSYAFSFLCILWSI